MQPIKDSQFQKSLRVRFRRAGHEVHARYAGTWSANADVKGARRLLGYRVSDDLDEAPCAVRLRSRVGGHFFQGVREQ